eukprot:4719233-Pyramimonas_sp.AAC.1
MISWGEAACYGFGIPVCHSLSLGHRLLGSMWCATASASQVVSWAVRGGLRHRRPRLSLE